MKPNMIGIPPAFFCKIHRMSQSQTFEKKLAELNTIVEKMEQPGVGLEESLKLYEKGIALTRECQKIIDQAEQKIAQLLEESN